MISEDDYPTGPIALVPRDDEFWEDQPRDDRGRWAPKEVPLQYERLVAPELAPVAVTRQFGGAMVSCPDTAADRYVRLQVERCPHGSFARWAARNCCKPRPTRKG